MSKYRETPHPNDADLFLYIEDELDSRARNDLRMHLAACWECRSRKEEFERGVRSFMEYRRDVLIPRLAPPQSNPHSLRSRLPARPETMFRVFPVSGGPRSVPVASGISVALILALLTTYVLRPPQLTASEFFRNVSQAASNPPVPPSKMKAQRVRVRQGARTIEREILHNQGLPAGDAADAQWNGLLANLPVNAQDPLNPAEFAQWHASQPSPRDEIVESGKTITLTSTVPALRASLVVRSSDWHPIAKQFEVPGQPPVEIREIAFELRNLPAPAITRTTVPDTPAPVPVRPEPLAEPGPDLELAELEVREVLRETAADRTEIPAIVRRDGRVRVDAVTETGIRRHELAAALAVLPHVEAHVVEQSEAVPGHSAKPLRVVPPAYPTDPPLARALWEYMGSMDSANSYLDTAHGQWLRAMSATQVLGRLASRYPETVTLSSALPRERLNQLAGHYRAEVASLAGAYLRHLHQPLDAMLQLRGMTAPVAAPSTACASWQALAPALLEALEALQLPVRRLFLVDYAESPLALSAEPLLTDAAQARARLRQLLGCLTQP